MTADDLYNRSPEDWDRMVDVGMEFLISRARLNRPTSYTEFNAVLVSHRLPGFDFNLQSERTALGQLLYRITMAHRAKTGRDDLMLSAMAYYLNISDAGPGFYDFARELHLMPPQGGDKLAFWTGQMAKLHALYGPSDDLQNGRQE